MYRPRPWVTRKGMWHKAHAGDLARRHPPALSAFVARAHPRRMTCHAAVRHQSGPPAGRGGCAKTRAEHPRASLVASRPKALGCTHLVGCACLTLAPPTTPTPPEERASSRPLWCAVCRCHAPVVTKRPWSIRGMAACTWNGTRATAPTRCVAATPPSSYTLLHDPAHRSRVVVLV